METYHLVLDSSESDAHDYTVALEAPLVLSPKKAWLCGVKSGFLYNAKRNVASTGVWLKYYDGTDWNDVTVSAGLYSVEGANELLQQSMLLNGDILTSDDIKLALQVNESTGYVQVYVGLGSGFRLQIMDPMATLFGCDDEDIFTSTQDLPNPPEVEQGIRGVRVSCNLVDPRYSIINGAQSRVLATKEIDTFPFSMMTLNPQAGGALVFLPCTPGTYDKIRIQITGTDGTPYETPNNPASITLIVKEAFSPS